MAVLLQKTEMLDRIPHGEEALQLDEVYVLKDSAVGVRLYQKKDKELQGHFSIVPGVFLLEAMLQTSMFAPSNDVSGFTGVLLKIVSADFRRKVEAGTVVHFEVQFLSKKGNILEYEGKGINREGQLVMRARFMCI